MNPGFWVRLLRNAVPAVPGGGVVFFVDPQGEQRNLQLVLHRILGTIMVTEGQNHGKNWNKGELQLFPC